LTDQPEKLDMRSQDIVEDKRQELLRLFPEIRTEGGKLDFEFLKLALGEAVDVGKERYGMTWPGKADCFRIIQAPSLGTLRPCPEESVNFDATENLIIEGDNLEVLKLLQKSYVGKVKMIYIDPPYNTGNDFIYPDNYTESLQTYLEYTGQVDAEGRKFGTNTEADGRFHSKWLSMMYPRLYLARNLLREDGVIFISIDDGELDNLTKVCDEVFGEENLVGVLSWVRTSTPAALGAKIKKTVEYVLCYERLLGGQRYQGVEKPVQSSNPLLNRPNPVSVLIFPPNSVTTGIADGVIRAGSYGTTAYDVELLSDAQVSEGRFASELRLRGRFRWRQEYLLEQLAKGVRIHVATSKMIPSYEKDSYGREALPNLIDSKVGVDTNEVASAEVRAIFSETAREIIDQMHPKPVSLIRYLVDAVCGSEDLILDFFAGSGTSGHAVLGLNKEDNGNRKFILVQLPEPTGRKDYPTIVDVTKERVRRVIKKLNDEDGGELGLDASKGQNRGFRCFKLAESNFKSWAPEAPKDAAGLAKQLELHMDHVRMGRTAADLLYEILLKSGFPLTTPVETLQLAGKTVHSVASGALVVCLERALTLELIRAIAEKKPERVACLDQGFAGNDQLKANAVQIFKTKGITSFKTV
jgi:adenine-specific DNA-methyltransferase